MCGFNFCFGEKISLDIVKMNSAISHRGLRSSVSGKDNLRFGHVRLPIQGTDEKFDQPYYYKNWIFLFVGEIFNYKELNPEAESDIQVLAEYWDKEGCKCFDRFDGFWSIIIYDTKSKTSWIVIDPLAKKPLYIDTKNKRISSEIKALTCLLEEPEIDDLYFARVCKWGYDIEGRTFDNRIRKIPPGIYKIDCIDLKMRLQRRFILSPKEVDIRIALEKSVKNRLVSDIPVALLLSGGLDSTIIYKLVQRYTNDIMVFHIENEETEWVDYLHIPDNKLIVLPKPEVNLNEVLFYNEGSVDLGSICPQYQMAKAVKEKGFNVVLTGDGADELFGGYERMRDYDAQQSDIFDELVYYHLPRLDKLMMSQTIELRSPFLALDVVRGALSWPYSDRINKVGLREIFSDIVPKEILERKKIPLKVKEVRDSPLEWRYMLVNTFKAYTMYRFYDGGKI